MLTLRNVFLTVCAAIVMASLPGLVLAQASDMDICASRTAKPADEVAACSRLIASGSLSNQNLATAYDLRGTAYYDLNEYGLAIADESQAIKLTPNSSGPYYNRANDFILTQRYHAAISDLNNAIRIGTLEPAYLARAYASRGIAYRGLHEWHNTIADETTAIHMLTKDETSLAAKSFTHRGFAYKSLGELQLAIKDFTRALIFNPAYTSALQQRAATYTLLGNYGLALKDINSEMILSPSADYLYRTRGATYFYLGKYTAALSDFKRDMAKERAYNALWYYLAQLHLHRASAAELASNTSTIAHTKWPAPIIAFFLGHATRTQVVAAANMGNATTKRNQHCEAAFYFGEWDLAHGNLPSARSSLTLAKRLCPPSYYESPGAISELARIAATHP